MLRHDLDTLWVLVAAALVFSMSGGFALLEAGFSRAKNCANTMAKNFVVFPVAALAYWLVGFGLMFGDGNPICGTTGFCVGEQSGPFSALAWSAVPLPAKFLFQAVFCAIVAAIVSGAVAERVRFHSFILFAVVLSGLIYPLVGHWVWGGGFLARWGFHDFAGAAVVHSVGGWAALAGVLVVGARIGKYRRDGSVHPIPGHSMTLATLGGLILWFGWFGFTSGRAMAADGEAISHIGFTTNLGGVGGAVGATFVAWSLLRKPDLGMMINGGLAGLVATTGACAWITPGAALLTGAMGGVLVVLGVIVFDRLHLDDPVGALSVHLVNGVFGTLAVGLFAHPAYLPAAGDPKPGLLYGGGIAPLGAQLMGTGVIALTVFPASLLVWHAVRRMVGLRVAPEDELIGLDVSEMGMEAYPHDSVIVSAS
ncbi:MAG: ammonium transporter [Armatimonadetes bacterium]|nr:ammonium transporter [Armatimonadota bacterium]